MALTSSFAAAADAPAWIEAWTNGATGRDARNFRHEHPVAWDWLRQDSGDRPTPGAIRREWVLKAARECGDGMDGLAADIEAALQAEWAENDARWAPLYARVCERRRELRLAALAAAAPAIAFVKRQVIRPSFFAYTEGQSDAQNERHFLPGSSLWLLRFDGTRPRLEQLLADPTGAIRDPAVSWDGRRLAFAWKKSLNDDDYHLYELDLATRALRQVTHGLGVADYEPAYLPDGGFIFSSTRCVQTVDCWWTEVSNLYTCDPAGRVIRRLGFDQVHTVYPQVLDDGRVIYTRWDYNDRGQVFPQPLFQMNSDGTNQREFYGNSSWFPTTIAHARGIPGTAKVLAILCGHHSPQAGKLAVIDPTRGRQENDGVQLVSPERETPAERIDAYGQAGELFAYPWPLSGREWLTSFAPDGWDAPGRRGGGDFGLYWMDRDGRRELLVSDPALPCLQPVVVAPRTAPPSAPRRIDLTKTAGAYHIRDIYQGRGLEGVERGTIRALRVVALDFRPAGIRANSSGGPAGGALISTPVAVGNGTWDVKRVLGETPVQQDGSACFEVPARTPVYFQALDARGRTVQTMRTWSTLQPGEVASCVGCHDQTNQAPPAQAAPLAGGRPRALGPAPGSGSGGFSFAREIQPILDRHCVACHHYREPALAAAAGGPPVLALDKAARSPEERRAFSLLGETVRDEPAGRAWSDSYLTLTQAARDNRGKGAFRGAPDGAMVRWHGSQSVPTPLPPGYSGSIRSPLLELLDAGHHGVRLTPAEFRALACWIDLFVPYCGDYAEANIWTPAEIEKYRHFEAKRLRFDDAASLPPARR